MSILREEQASIRPGEDPGREPAEPGGENLVGADAHAGGDAVGGEAVRGAGDPARHPGAVALEVAVAAVAQAGAVDVTEAEERLQVVARDEVPAERGIEHAVQLAVVRLDARVEYGDRDRVVAGRALPSGGHVHPAVVPLEDALGVGDAEEGGEVVPRVGDEAAVSVVRAAVRATAAASALVRAAVGRQHRVLEKRCDGAVRVEPRSEGGRAGNNAQGADRAQVGDHDAARRGDGGAHLGRGGLRREPDHGEPEWIAGGGGRSCECERDGKRCKEKSGPLHRFQASARKRPSSITRFRKVRSGARYPCGLAILR